MTQRLKVRIDSIFISGLFLMVIPCLVKAEETHTIPKSTFPWWFEPTVNAIAIIIAAGIGALVVRWQMAKQNEDNLNLQKLNMKENLKLVIYKEFADKIRVSSRAITKTMTNVIVIPGILSTNKKIFDMFKIIPMPMKDRAETLMTTHFNTSSAVGSLVQAIEKYEIAIPNFKQFVRGFAEQLDFFNKAYLDFNNEVSKFLPIDVPKDKVDAIRSNVITPKLASEDEIRKLQVLAQNYQSVCITLIGYITDLRIETQNNLLGNIFDKKLPPRKPLDTTVTVLTTDEEMKKERTPGSLA